MPYQVIELDLTKDRTTPEQVFTKPKDVGLEEVKKLKLIVLKADSEAYIIFDHKDYDKILCYQDLKIEYDFQELYVSNPIGTGKLIILVMW